MWTDDNEEELNISPGVAKYGVMPSAQERFNEMLKRRGFPVPNEFIKLPVKCSECGLTDGLHEPQWCPNYKRYGE